MAVSEEKQTQKRFEKQTYTAVCEEKNGHEKDQKPSNLKGKIEFKSQKPSDLTENYDGKSYKKVKVDHFCIYPSNL